MLQQKKNKNLRLAVGFDHLEYAGTVLSELNLDRLCFPLGVHTLALIISGHRLTAGVNLRTAYHRSDDSS